MLMYDWNTQAQRRTPLMTLTLLTHPATGPLQRTHCTPEHSVSLFLSPGAIGARGWYGVGPGAARLQQLGALVVVPADIPMHVSLPEAPPRTLFCCRFDGDQFRRLTGFEAQWESRALRACTDVRDNGIEALLRRLAEEIAAPGFASETLVSGLGLTFMAEIARYLRRAQDRSAPRGGLAPWQLRRVQECIADGAGAAPTIEALAALCGIGGRHLMRAFKQSTGQTVMGYVQQVRVERAKALLAEGALPLREVARELGFSHYSGFAAAFRQAAGTTPRAFRQRHGAPARRSDIIIR
jgi:AraC family transcriptional regulator